nr:MAG TPA_asm: hypothetical protein [Caudoviricetes sp.]
MSYFFIRYVLIFMLAMLKSLGVNLYLIFELYYIINVMRMM